MAIRRQDILAAAQRILSEYGLADLTMRRLAAELDVQPGALYWHVPNKQALLAELADDLLARVPEPSSRRRWDRQLTQLATDLRTTLLGQRDGAEVVSASRASSLDTSHLGKRIVEIVQAGGHTHAHASASRDALLHFVIGYTFDEQSHALMAEHGAAPARFGDSDAAYAAALSVVIAGVRAPTAGRAAPRPAG
ncbi:TetR family transcriptional regulator [Luteipulveratus flavus]|uniref:TetR family transcriptional regulator n=1 Tax=Luteipulveratus flavus TaxID=3031728 RepID=A0ABT6C2V5_9MICO|nr:TetR family transcriptional regulator [Luteipulveratus sp. YIM 133296]MDF8263040.1 TetR family transcriptional regulator [Luteipulveratus sp. YIM 133296]